VNTLPGSAGKNKLPTSLGLQGAAARLVKRPVAYGQASAWRSDTNYGWIMAFLIGLMIVRMLIPGFFEYKGEDAKVADSGQAYNQIIWWGILAVGSIIIVWRSALSRAMLGLLNPWFFLFFAFALCSALWSIDPGATTRRMIRVVIILVACWALVLVAWHPRRFQDTVRPVVTALLLGSLIFGLLYPDLAITPPTPTDPKPSWHGLAAQKNQLGALASFGAIFWFHGWLLREISGVRAALGCAISLACLFLSRSSTSLMVTVFAFMLLVLLLRSPPNLRRYMPYFITLFLIVILIYAVAILRLIPGLEILLAPLTALTGKSATFSDRSIIWGIVSEQIAVHPVLGSGYGAYWAGPFATSASYVFLGKMNFYPWSSHNGYLDIINDLGIVGLMIFGAFVNSYVRQSIRLLSIDRGQSALYLGLLFQQVLTNLSETHWLTPLNVDFVLMTIVVFAMARSLLDSRFQETYGSPKLAMTSFRRAS
jgi:O-antigen ligase